MLKPDGTPMTEIFLEDNLHMNAKGYSIWKKEIATSFIERLNKLTDEKTYIIAATFAYSHLIAVAQTSQDAKMKTFVDASDEAK